MTPQSDSSDDNTYGRTLNTDDASPRLFDCHHVYLEVDVTEEDGIPADGFYEWKVVNEHKIPHHICMRDGSVFAFAGLWDHWEGDGVILDSCTIIVMPSNEVMKPIHKRMPAIIAPAEYDWWLDARVTDKQEIMQYLSSAPSSQLTAYPVSTWVNVPKHDDERCIKPAGL